MLCTLQLYILYHHIGTVGYLLAFDRSNIILFMFCLISLYFRYFFTMVECYRLRNSCYFLNFKHLILLINHYRKDGFVIFKSALSNTCQMLIWTLRVSNSVSQLVFIKKVGSKSTPKSVPIIEKNGVRNTELLSLITPSHSKHTFIEKYKSRYNYNYSLYK